MRRGLWRLAIFSGLAILLAAGVTRWETYQYRVLDCPSSASVAERARQWRALYPSQPVDLHGVQQSLMDEDMLLKEALLLGIHREDVVIQQRLNRDMSFLKLDGQGLEKDSPLLEALILGDVVIRRRLLQRMEAMMTATAPEVSSAAIQNEAWRVDFQQYLFRERSTAEQALANGEYSEAIPFLHGGALMGLDQARVDALFGDRTDMTLPSLPLRQWFGPVQSPYGWHVLRVVDRRKELIKVPSPPSEMSASALTRLRDKYRNLCHAT